VAPGADGLRKPARAVHYSSTKRGTVLKDLLRAGGEKLSGTADQGVLGAALPFYTQIANPVGLSISALFADTGAVWRMLPDGTLWVGQETWPDSGLTPEDYANLGEQSHLALVELGVDARFPLPGQKLDDGRKVSSTEVSIEGGAVRARLFVA
jgi:hypothetical protein